MTITGWVHRQLEHYVKSACCCVDATAGKGNDTLFMCQNMEQSGKVYAFDIQKEALDAAKGLLCENGYLTKEGNSTENGCHRAIPQVELILDSHEHMEQYVSAESVDVMMFNLGYLPGGDHSLATKPATTITAIEKGLELLKVGGVMSVCIYSGGDSGFEERDAVLDYLEALDAKQYTVIMSSFYNKPNHPPIPVLIQKERKIKQ